MDDDTDTDITLLNERFRHWEQQCACDIGASFGLPCVTRSTRRVVYTTTTHAPKCLRCEKPYMLVAESVDFVCQRCSTPHVEVRHGDGGCSAED